VMGMTLPSVDMRCRHSALLQDDPLDPSPAGDVGRADVRASVGAAVNVNGEFRTQAEVHFRDRRRDALDW
jgi:hypothetical protein